MRTKRHQFAELKPLANHKIHELLQAKDKNDDLEASGICIKEGHYYVIFDNLRKIAKINEELVNESHKNKLTKTEGFDDDNYEGYEDITCNRNTGDFYLLIEAQKNSNTWRSRIIQCNARFKHCKASWLEDARIEIGGDKHNKGLEGISWLQRNAMDYLFLLQEETGAIYICRRELDQWVYEKQLKLPSWVQFDDYASLDIKDNRVAVVSQASAKLWVGQLHDSSWDFVDEGKVYRFPDRYCNIEGVAWKSSSRIVVVSDKAKEKQPRSCRELDQSIHIFELPSM